MPSEYVKNGEDRLIVLNDTAKSVIENQRGKHTELVFPYEGKALKRMTNSAWRRSWKDAGLPTSPEYRKGVHNLKHTYGARLRSVGVPIETRRVLLGHTDGNITTHYSAAQIADLIEASNKVASSQDVPNITILKLKLDK